MAQKQPAYRRPSWARHEKSFAHYMRTDLARDRKPGDYGVDNFSFDESHVEKWTIPAEILARLPSELQKPAEEWQFAGAALCTALDRINKLEEESLYRGFPEPEHSSHPHLSRRVSNAQWPAAVEGAGADTPPMSSPVSPEPGSSFSKLPSALLPLETSFNGLPQRQIQVMGMESPPFTPTDSQTCSTPEYPLAMPSAMPDVHALTRQLSPISLRSRGDSTTSSGYSTFDESAWDVYLNTLKAEMIDIRTNALPRLKGLGHTVEKLSIEYSRDGRYKAAIDEFNAWWADNKGQAVEWESRVRELELPTLESVFQERLAMGLTV